MTNRIELIEACTLYLPILLTVFCWYCYRPKVPLRGALVLSFLWSIVSVFLINQLAFQFAWWSFSSSAIAYHDLPLSIWFGWSIAWGLALPLLPARIGPLLLSALILDLLLMPLLTPLLHLGENWIWGEIVSIILILLPALLVYKWTIHRKSIHLRVIAQALVFFSFTGFFLPDLILSHLENKPFRLQDTHPFLRGIQFNLMFFWIVIGISAAREFIKQGKGTPVPFDPPQKMVRTGLYAYVSNPMQLSTVGGMLSYAWVLNSWGLVAAAIMTIEDLSNRFGDEWRRYRSRIKRFAPNWKPYEANPPSTIYFSKTCPTCAFLAKWLKSQHPHGLIIEDAEGYKHGCLKRLHYKQGDVYYEGVDAFACGLSHINLGWAIIACFIQLPGISHTLQLITDANMFGPVAENLCETEARTIKRSQNSTSDTHPMK